MCDVHTEDDTGVLPVEHALGRLARLPTFFLPPRPNSGHNGYPDQRWSGCRFRFFLPDKSVQLVQFCLFDLFGHRSIRQFGSVLTHPIGNTLWIDLQNPGNSTITIAFHIHANGEQSCFLWITIRPWIGRVHTFTRVATILLAA